MCSSARSRSSPTRSTAGADPFLLDPAQVLRFSLVERIREVVGRPTRVAAAEHAALEHPEWLLLAALILDTAGDDTSPVELARRLAHRLDLGAAAEQQIALLVGDSDCSAPRPASRRARGGAGHARSRPTSTTRSEPARSTCSTLALRRSDTRGTRAARRAVRSCSARWSSPTSPASRRATSWSADGRRRSAAAGDERARRRAHRARAPGVPAEPGRTRHRAPGRVPRAAAGTRRSERRGASESTPATSGASRSRRVTGPGCSPPSSGVPSPTTGSTSSTPSSPPGATAPRSTPSSSGGRARTSARLRRFRVRSCSGHPIR